MEESVGRLTLVEMHYSISFTKAFFPSICLAISIVRSLCICPMYWHVSGLMLGVIAHTSGAPIYVNYIGSSLQHVHLQDDFL
jgi:hypothetical protein